MLNAHKLLEEYAGTEDPSKICVGTNQKLPWMCSVCENLWSATGDSRSNRGRGCPACAGNAVHSSGSNSLLALSPRLAGELQEDASKVLPNTSRKLLWKCSLCSNLWVAAGCDRYGARKNGCPACSGRSVHSDGRNSMAVTHPLLALEYQGDATKVMAGVARKLQWRCPSCSHKWKTTGDNRVRKDVGCPACAGRLHSDGLNSLAILRPDLAIEYAGDATLVSVGSAAKSAWICARCNHSWTATISQRSGASGSGCPACSVSGYAPTHSGGGYLYLTDNYQGGFGITNCISNRTAKHNQIGVSIGLVFHHTDAKIAEQVEKLLKKHQSCSRYLKFEDRKLLPIGFRTETLLCSDWESVICTLALAHGMVLVCK
jgi:rubrerythrin